LEAAESVLDRDDLARESGEDFRHIERLRKELLDLPRAINDLFIFRRKLIETEDRDDVLQVLVALKHVLNAARDIVVLLADDPRIERLGEGRKRIDSRVNPELRDRTLEND